MYNENNGDKLTLSNSIITCKEFSCHTIHFYHRFGFHVHIFLKYNQNIYLEYHWLLI